MQARVLYMRGDYLDAQLVQTSGKGFENQAFPARAIAAHLPCPAQRPTQPSYNLRAHLFQNVPGPTQLQQAKH